MTAGSMIEWTRLELVVVDPFEDDGGPTSFVELAIHGKTVFVRTGRGSTATRTEAHELSTEVAAKASFEKRIQAYRKKKYDPDRKFMGPVPAMEAAPAAAKVTSGKNGGARLLAERVATLERDFLARLAKAGIDPDRTFMGQTRGEEDWNELARRCLEIAEQTLGVEFARAYFDDEEHGTDGWPLPDDRYAEFYESPRRVARIAGKRLLGKLTESDGRFPRPLRQRGQRASSKGGRS